jgi:hypothetical protein
MRENGFYWVYRNGNWVVAEWSVMNRAYKVGYWLLPGSDIEYEDEDFKDIEETPIKRTT